MKTSKIKTKTVASKKASTPEKNAKKKQTSGAAGKKGAAASRLPPGPAPEEDKESTLSVKTAKKPTMPQKKLLSRQARTPEKTASKPTPTKTTGDKTRKGGKETAKATAAAGTAAKQSVRAGSGRASSLAKSSPKRKQGKAGLTQDKELEAPKKVRKSFGTGKGAGRFPERKAAVNVRQSAAGRTKKGKGRTPQLKAPASDQQSDVRGTKKGKDLAAGQNANGRKISGRTEDKRGLKDITWTELPEEYGENDLLLMPVDPNVVFVDWEIRKKDFPKSKNRLVMRVFDVTSGRSPAGPADSFLDFRIEGRVGCGFFNINLPGRNVEIEIGFSEKENFRPILRSLVVSMPRSLVIDELGIAEGLFEMATPIGY